MQTLIGGRSSMTSAFGPRYMSLQEALHSGVTVEESKSQLEKLIIDHFHHQS